MKIAIVIAQIYVDDIVFGSTSQLMTIKFIECMKNEFEMSMVGELNYFLQVKQCKKGIFISQSKYARNLVKRFGLENACKVRIPMSQNDKLTRDDTASDVHASLYRSMIGILLYLTANRPAICFSVGVCARYQARPKESHLMAVKKIIRYVSGTTDHGKWFTSDTNTHLARYNDVDWAGNVDDRKITTGGCFFIGNNLVSWCSKK